MKFGIRRRTIDLTPATEEDAEWVFSNGGDRSQQTRAEAKTAHRSGKIVVGVIRRRAKDDRNTSERIGFVFLIPIGEATWDFTIMIPDRSHRDLFSALHASDAIAHYMFDHCRIDAAVWRIREDNRRAQGLARRLNYLPRGTVEHDGHTYQLFVLDGPTWETRHASLKARSNGLAFRVIGE